MEVQPDVFVYVTSHTKRANVEKANVENTDKFRTIGGQKSRPPRSWCRFLISVTLTNAFKKYSTGKCTAKSYKRPLSEHKHVWKTSHIHKGIM